MNFISALNFYTKFIEKLNINLKPFYDLLNENTPWSWTTENETLFHKLKNALTSHTELTIPNTNNPFSFFFLVVEASLIGLSAGLFQPKKMTKLKTFRTTPVYLIRKNQNSLHQIVNSLV